MVDLVVDRIAPRPGFLGQMPIRALPGAGVDQQARALALHTALRGAAGAVARLPQLDRTVPGLQVRVLWEELEGVGLCGME